MSLEENFEAYLKEKYANEEKEQNTETDKPNFRGGFLEFLPKDENERFDARQSSMAVLLDWNLPHLFGTRDIKKYLTNLVFSVRTVSYGSSFLPLGKNSVRNLQYGPRTRLARRMSGL